MILEGLFSHVSCYHQDMKDQELPIQTERDDVYLLKHVNAVAFVPVKGGKRISLVGRRVFNILLHRSMADGDLDEYHAPLHEIVEDTGTTSNNSTYVKKILRELMSTTVEWQSPSSSEIETWDACNLLSGAGITKDKKSGAVTIRWRFDSHVKEQLLKPERYSRLSLEAITQLSSHAAMALYEICARYVDNPAHTTARQHWRWWRPVLTGVSTDNTNVEYRFFKRDFINKAIAEINSSTNIEVRGPIEYKEKDNKTISDIQFEVYLKPDERKKNTKPLSVVGVLDLPAIARAISMGIKQKDAEDLIVQFGPELFTMALEELEKRSLMPDEIAGKVIKPSKWLKTVLEKSLAEKMDTTRTIKKPKDVINNQRTAWGEEWLTRQKDSLIYEFQDSTEEIQKEMTAIFRTELKESLQPQILKRFEISGWDHRMVRATFIKFLGTQRDGKDWDKPTADQILAIAAEMATAPPNAAVPKD